MFTWIRDNITMTFKSSTSAISPYGFNHTGGARRDATAYGNRGLASPFHTDYCY